MTDKQAIRQLLATRTVADIAALAQQHSEAALGEAEDAKTHPLIGFQMAPADFEALCAYLSDGGGVRDDSKAADGSGVSLTQAVWQAIAERKQGPFWKKMPHLLKSWIAQRGLAVQILGAPGATVGGVFTVTGAAGFRALVRGNALGTPLIITCNGTVADA